MIEAWQKILWREWRHCQDESYKRRLGRLVVDVAVDDDTRSANRPTPLEVEQALVEACRTRPLINSMWSHILQDLSEQLAQPESPDQLIANLNSDDWTVRFIARHTLTALGGEVATRLAQTANQDAQLRPTIQEILRHIEVETTQRLFPLLAQLVCPRCLVHCHPHWIDVPGVMPLGYYGCRNCNQSREFLEWPGPIVTVLNTAMTEPYLEQNDTLRGNWFLLQTLFDGDWIEIIRANDEAVERFAMQIGNDTDEIRQPRYQTMRCVIGRDCELSENTRRILQHRFGQVEQMDVEE